MVTKKEIKKERDPLKLRDVLIKKGYPNWKLPKWKVAHHPKPVAEWWKTTPKNIKVISETRHKQIHKNNRKKWWV